MTLFDFVFGESSASEQAYAQRSELGLVPLVEKAGDSRFLGFKEDKNYEAAPLRFFVNAFFHVFLVFFHVL